MKKYFLHKKFWLPIVIMALLVLLVELFLRLGFLDSYIKPGSFLGNAIYREKAIKEFGLDKIHWITIGDSKIDWGIEHGKILDIQKKNGLNHLRLSFGSSGFMAIQTTIDWSIANMPNLQGIMIGVSEDSFDNYSDMLKQYKVLWPFKNYINYEKYIYSRNNDFTSNLIISSALFVYYHDIKSLLINPVKRFARITYFFNKKYHNIFKYNRNLPNNICNYSISTLSQCIKTAEQLKLQERSSLKSTKRLILNHCGNNSAKYRNINNLSMPNMPEEKFALLFSSWDKLIKDILVKKIELKIIILPEHEMYDYSIKSQNAKKLLHQLISNNINNKFFKVYDFRSIFQNESLCNFYEDPIHLNNKGKKVVTQKIINEVLDNKQPLPVKYIKKKNKIWLNNFEKQKL